MSTIYEVADRAGVSAATVSRYFNGLNVSAEKAQRVRAAADEMAFTPNRTARRLRTQTSEIIALVIPDIENPFFTSLARGVEDVTQDAGYSVVLCNTDEDPAKEARYLDIAVSENMAGVILAAADDHTDLRDVIARNRPVVAVDRVVPGFDIDAVTLDNLSGGRTATQALIQQGYKRIACITGPRNLETAELRSAGWRQALAVAGLPDPSEDYLRHADYRMLGGEQAMRDLLALPEPPDAVFVANNLMSVGALHVLTRAGLNPPTVGLASFGDLPYTDVDQAGVVVIHLPSRQLGETAAKLLLGRIGGDKESPRTIIVRNSNGHSQPSS